MRNYVDKIHEKNINAKPVFLLNDLSSVGSSYFRYMSDAQQSITRCFHNSCCPCSCQTEYLPGYEQYLTNSKSSIFLICSQLNKLDEPFGRVEFSLDCERSGKLTYPEWFPFLF